MSLSEVAQWLQAERIGADVRVDGVSTDTRTLDPGTLYVALTGPRFDGHDFVQEAEARGASALLVSRLVKTRLPQLKVEDTREALGRLAAAWRAQHDIPLIGITGSNGKTTTKEMLAAILARLAPVLVTRGNRNNDIGMPLTLLELRREHRYAVIEMGANHPGEIDYLTRIARPTVALITNAGPAHLEGFGSVEGVARAKSEIFHGLGPGGTAVLNADDRYFELWREKTADFRQVTFALEHGADVSARDVRAGAGGHPAFDLVLPGAEVAVQLPVPGRHNVLNALAAAAAAWAVGVSPADIGAGLEALHAIPGRLRFLSGRNGVRVIDDCYNANPASLQAALDALSGWDGERWLVLGDMGELGPDARELHRRAGLAARGAGVTRLYTLGELSEAACDAFGQGARHFTDRAELIAALERELHSGTEVLVKGSRAMRMEDIVRALTGTAAEAADAGR